MCTLKKFMNSAFNYLHKIKIKILYPKNNTWANLEII